MALSKIHDINMIPKVQDHESRDDCIRADSIFASALYEEPAEVARFKRHSNEKGLRCHAENEDV